eukprot:COSAG05_NODE_26_length_29797_cov_35.911139_10_plen_97_part_00
MENIMVARSSDRCAYCGAERRLAYSTGTGIYATYSCRRTGTFGYQYIRYIRYRYIRYLYRVRFFTVFLGICIATAPLYILKSSLAPDLLFDIGFFA